MASVGVGGGLSAAASLSSKRPPWLLTSTLVTPHYNINNNIKSNQRRSRRRRRRNGTTTCKAELSREAPVVLAIGACVLNSLVFPETPERDDGGDDESPVIDSTDARLAVMGLISLIPYFNWLSWVFAWLDTGKQRYLVYALVYLAPYLRTNLSISPEESWLPLSSILFCIIHIQLEASVRNGDFQEFQLFRGSAKKHSVARKKGSHSHGHDSIPEEELTEEYQNLPSARDQSRNTVQGWGVPEKPLPDPEHVNEDGDSSNKRKH